VKVLVYPHTMEIGGSQLNAIEIAAAVRDRGHDVIVVSRPGALVETVRQLGLRHVTLDPRARRTLSPRALAHLTSLVRENGIDVVHGYEWPPGVEAVLGPRLRLGVPVVCTIMSGSVAPFLPRTLPLIVGTNELRSRELAAGRAPVTLLEPPVDTRANAPGYDPGPFRKELGLDAATPLISVVGRLVSEMKLEGVLAACDAVGELARSGVSVQLAVVGDGPARPAVEEAAAAANARAGQLVVALAGELYDPRPAYAAADVVLGMGGSALRGMAFGKPLVVQGMSGFWELLTPESAPLFLSQGWGGSGPDGEGRAEGRARLASILPTLLDDPATRTRLGDFGRALVAERYGLDHAAAIQEEVYASAVQTTAHPFAARLVADAARTGNGAFWHKARRRWQRWRGTVAIEDFNIFTERGAQLTGRGHSEQGGGTVNGAGHNERSGAR
jgi:glycosyltransferase involved in cell wall biosynthesis